MRSGLSISTTADSGTGCTTWLSSLWELRHRNDYESFRSALTGGYARHRPLPPGYLAHLDDFIATREVAFGLWFTGTAQVSPHFRADLDQVQADIARSLDTLLRN